MNYGRPTAIVPESPADPVPVDTDMAGEHAIGALKALSQPARMEIFRMVYAAPDGVEARVIASRVGGPNSVVSMHLAILSRARLLLGQRMDGRVIYRINRAAVSALLRFMSKCHD